MKRDLIIGVMGGGSADHKSLKDAERLGNLIAENGWMLLNGGRNAGIMEASARGAAEKGGITIGILPDDNNKRVSEYISIPILTGMGNARNAVNVLTADMVVACPGGAGTISEIALALKTERQVICLNFNTGDLFNKYQKRGLLFHEKDPERVIERIRLIEKKKYI